MHRERADRRLERARVAPQTAAQREIAVRLFARATEPAAPREVVGEQMVVRKELTVKPLRPARVEPNAPLLARLVRHPFSLPIVRFRKLALPERKVDASLRRVRRERLDLHRPVVTHSNPMRGPRPKAKAPPRPFDRVRELVNGDDS